MNIDNRTHKALGDEVMEQLRLLRFCIVGCGGTGANFAEMLVRTGALQLTLIDGTEVEESNLNRVFSFYHSDCGKPKVEVLKRHLESIRPGLHIHILQDSFKKPEDILEGHLIGQRVRDAVHDADVVFIGTDTNRSRLAIEKLCQDKCGGMFLSCGVLVDRKSDVFEFECAWSPQTPSERVDDEGYGPENASFASVIHEATSVAFTMLLNHLSCANSDFKLYRRRYNACFRPVETVVNGRSNNHTPLYLSPRRLWHRARQSFHRRWR